MFGWPPMPFPRWLSRDQNISMHSGDGSPPPPASSSSVVHAGASAQAPPAVSHSSFVAGATSEQFPFGLVFCDSAT